MVYTFISGLLRVPYCSLRYISKFYYKTLQAEFCETAVRYVDDYLDIFSEHSHII